MKRILGIYLFRAKDFFAFDRGLSLSVPDAAKPGLMRECVRYCRPSRLPALLSVAAGAVAVNLT